jgi:replicative DNA helicase
MNNDIAKTIPFSNESEQSVIGALLLDNDAIDAIAELRPEHFHRADHRLIFSTVREMIAKGGGADAMTVFSRMQAEGRAAQVGGLLYLNDLAQNTPSAANIRRYAQEVIDRAQLRDLQTAAHDILESIAQPKGATPAQLADRATAAVGQVCDTTMTQGPVSVHDALTEHLARLERRADGGEPSISTGIDDLDRQLNGGLRAGWVAILAARPGMGKTALALNIASHVAQSRSALFLSMEMPSAELLDRNIAALGRIPLDRVMAMEYDDHDAWDAVTRATQKMSEMNLQIDDQAALTLAEVRSKARAVKRKHGLDLLIVDYLQLMAGEGHNRNAEIEGISRGLKALAKELGCAVLALAQLNRKVEGENRMPMLSDLRDSGSIEQDADAVLFIHREEVSNADAGPQWKGFARARLAKFRHGQTGDIAMSYRGDFMTFGKWSGPWPEADDTPKRQRARDW